MNITVPELSLVVMIGASGSGKSTLARRLFKPTEILSSDACRAWVSDDETDQESTHDAFDVLYYMARKRLSRGLLTVIDATNVRAEDREPLVALAREYHCLLVALVVDTPEHICHERNAGRDNRRFGPHVVRSQRGALRREIRGIHREGFKQAYFLRTPEECDAATLTRQPLWTNRKTDRGPFDIIGDVHGCYDELIELIRALGYTVAPRAGEPEGACDLYSPNTTPDAAPRKLLFLGDLVDRGPKTPAVLRFVMEQVERGRAICVPGNHDFKLIKALRGRDVQLNHGLAESMAQLAEETPEFRAKVTDFLDRLVSHFVLDDGRLVVAHAGMKESMAGRGSGAVREFALYGETTGETDEFGLPIRYNWAAEYRGRAAVVYGHTPVPRAEWLNNTICLDTGCVFGGSLTALRWPERELVSIKSKAIYAESRRPFLLQDPSALLSLQQQHDDVLNYEDVSGKRRIETRLFPPIIVREGHAAAALEIMSRFAADPRWVIYLPPTMSPCETSNEPGLLEHPREAFAYFRENGIERVVCEEKHMGSRAVVIICKDENAARRRFGAVPLHDKPAPIGIVYTRTGRPFFADEAEERSLLERVQRAMSNARLWEELDADWACLDCELMPWSAKAQGLIREQYAAVGAAATAGLRGSVAALARTAARLGPDKVPPLASYTEREALIHKYIDSYRRYCWDVRATDDLRLAPFHILASGRSSADTTEGRVHTARDHIWHMETLAKLAATGDPVLVATPFKVVDLSDPVSEQAATDWWTSLTSAGGEGMVVKPLDFIVNGPRGLVQPAVKVRGPEYLRIIYGPEYTMTGQIERLRDRRLGTKRAMALREFALGIEALERFARSEPLRRVHECVFAVLAMESEPVDPRL